MKTASAPPAPQQKPPTTSERKMSKLTDEQMRDVLKNTNHMVRNSMYGAFWPELEQACRAIEAAATEPLLQRIAELEQRNRDLYEDVQRFRKHAMNEKAARLELERQLHEQAVSLEGYPEYRVDS